MLEISIIGTGIGIVSFTYMFLRNFKIDVNKKIDRLETRLDQNDDRMFWLMTGKTLSEAILAEKMKEKK